MKALMREPDKPLARLRRLEWRVRHAADNVLTGEYRSAIRGQGMEFDSVVPYEYGDDVRDMDWKVTARLGAPYRKKFIEEREVTVLVALEDSRTLQFGSGARSKREVLLELAGLVMLLSAVNRDRVAVAYASPEGGWCEPPVRGRNAILHQAARLLGQEAPALEDARPAELPWKSLAHLAPRHSVLLWLGDFPPRAAPADWAVMRRRYQTAGFRVEDPWEREWPEGLGEVLCYDPDGEEVARLDSGSRAQRGAHAAWRARRQAAWEKMFPDPLARLTVGADEDALDALVRFFHKRMRRRRGG